MKQTVDLELQHLVSSFVSLDYSQPRIILEYGCAAAPVLLEIFNNPQACHVANADMPTKRYQIINTAGYCGLVCGFRPSTYGQFAKIAVTGTVVESRLAILWLLRLYAQGSLNRPPENWAEKGMPATLRALSRAEQAASSEEKVVLAIKKMQGALSDLPCRDMVATAIQVMGRKIKPAARARAGASAHIYPR